MIKNISVKNFKSLKNISMNTAPLNLLVGLNGVGKSSFLQFLLLFMQSTSRHILLNGDIINMGKVKDILYQFAESDCIEICLDTTSKKWEQKIHVRDLELDVLDINEEYLFTNMREYLRTKLLYLETDRVPPTDIHEMSRSNIEQENIGIRGEYTIHFLSVYGSRMKVNPGLLHSSTSEPSLLNQVDAWLSEISPGIRLAIKELPYIDKIILNYEYNLESGMRTMSFNPRNVGFGISYVLPVITSLLINNTDKILIIENPESHIHPKGQAELGKLIALSAEAGKQIFVETHSDHIINGVRVAVKDGLISKESVNIAFFNKENTNNEQYTSITQIKVDKNGELSEYPTDFLDEWNNQLLKLI